MTGQNVAFVVDGVVYRPAYMRCGAVSPPPILMLKDSYADCLCSSTTRESMWTCTGEAMHWLPGDLTYLSGRGFVSTSRESREKEALR